MEKTPLLPLDKVPVVPIGKQPSFCTPTSDWLDNIVEGIIEEASKEDSVLQSSDRCRPWAFVRCSRGGKTRTLREIQCKLHEKGQNVILVSFNDFSTVEHHEHLDTVGALCRRIAFAAMNGVAEGRRMHVTEYKSRARNLAVKPEDITSWLGSDTPCILLIDELNVLIDTDTTPPLQNELFATFLKENFLQTRNRYFVFTSHISTEAGALSTFMDNYSSRLVNASRLPTIASLGMAHTKLKLSTLTATEALYYGLIPALLLTSYQSQVGSDFRFNGKLDKILKTFSESCDDDVIRRTLKTYIEGAVSLVPPVLLPLMDVVQDENARCGNAVWIFCHLSSVLRGIRTSPNPSISSGLRSNCAVLEGLLEGLLKEGERLQSGDAWESLFCITLMIRLITRSFDSSETLLPLPTTFRDCQVSFGRWFQESEKGQGKTELYPDVKNVEALMNIIVPPWGDTEEETKKLYPHVVLYKPPYAKFEVYDMILVAYESKESKPILFGYRLKEGYSCPSKEKKPSEKCKMSFLVCGKASRKPKSGISEWTVAGNEEVSSFLGDSGSVLEPSQWRKFASEGVPNSSHSNVHSNPTNKKKDIKGE